MISRRDLMKRSAVLAGVAATFGLATPAFADLAEDLEAAKEAVEMTEAEIEAAQKKLDAAEEELEVLASEYEELSKVHADTLGQIADVKQQIADTQAKIEEKQAELELRQQILSNRVSSAYKSGPDSFLQILFRSSTFEEFTSNVYYLDKITESDRELVEGIKRVKAELDEEKAKLEQKQAELEELSAKEEQQLAEMQAKQEEVLALINALDDDVKALMARRDEELAAQAAAAEALAEERRRAAAAAAAASAGPLAPMPDLSNVTGSQADIIAACYVTPSPGGGLCAMWVSQVFANAGYGYVGGNACDMYSAWCYSEDFSSIEPGMIVACSTHPHTWAGRIWGHVGIYIGEGTVMDNIGYIRTISLSEWVSYYSTTVPVRCGWLGGMVLA